VASLWHSPLPQNFPAFVYNNLQPLSAELARPTQYATSRSILTVSLFRDAAAPVTPACPWLLHTLIRSQSDGKVRYSKPNCAFARLSMAGASRCRVGIDSLESGAMGRASKDTFLWI